MTAGAITPYRSDMRAGRDGFAQLLHAEWTKFRTVPGWITGLAAAAIVIVLLGLPYLFPIIAAVITDPHWQRHLEQIGPMSAGLAIQATTGLRSLPLSPWTGLGVLAAWAAAALLAGGLLLQLQDA